MNTELPLINTQNWNHTLYKTLKIRAFISMGGDFNLAEEDSFGPLYYITLVDSEDAEILQKDFSDLSSALTHINNSYAHWDFQDLKSLSEEGCGSCSAH